MRMLLVSRVCFALTGFGFAALALPGPRVGSSAMLAGAVLLLGLVLVLRQQRQLLTALRDWRCWLAAALLAAGLIANAWCLAYLPLTLFAAGGMMTPIWAALLAPLFGERLGRWDGVALLLAVSGGLVLAGGSGGLDGLGGLLLLANTVCIACYLHLCGRVRRAERHQPLPWAAGVYLSSGPLCWLALGGWSLPGGQLAWALAAGALLACGDVLVVVAMRTVKAAQTVMLKPLSALISSSLGVLFLHAPLTWNIALGGALVGGAAMLVGGQNSGPGEPSHQPLQ